MAKRRALGWLLAVVAALAVLVAIAGLLATPQKALAPPTASQALLAAADALDSIAIQADFDPDANVLSVLQTFTLVNRTGTSQGQLVLRAWANAFRSQDYSPAATDELFDSCYPGGFSAGGLTSLSLAAPMADGAEQALALQFDDDAHTVLRLTLPQPWADGGTLTLRASYDVHIPAAAYRFGENGGIWALGNVFLTPAPYLEGAYRTDAYFAIGDPFVSQCRNYDVRLTVPQGYTVGGSAAAVPVATADGRQTLRLSALAARDFALCISRKYRLAQAMAGDVLVLAYATTDSGARAMLDTAAQALTVYGQLYGAYPYPTFTLCEVAFPLGATEYPGLAMVATNTVQKGGDTLAQQVALQAAHQWWYAVVGSDSFYDAWQDEALCEFSLLAYWGARHGEAARAELRYARVDTAMRVTIPRGVTPGSPLDYFGDYSEYRVVVNGRGAAALCALDTAMNGGLNVFLKHYRDTFAFRIATRADFETLLRQDTGEDWSPLLSDYLDTYLAN